MEGLIFEGALRAISKYKTPGGAYIWRGDLTEGFLCYEFGGAYIWRGLYMEGLIFGILRYIFEIVFGSTSSFWRAQVRGILARIFYYHLIFLLLRFIINGLSLRLIKIQQNK